MPAMPAPPAPTDRDDSAAGTGKDAASPEAEARFRGACETHLDFVCRYARACGVDASALEHVVHKVFSVMRGRLISLEDAADLRVSIAGITRHVVRAYLRQLGTPLEALGQTEARSPDDLNEVEAVETKTAAELVDIILSSMSEAEREVFVLCEIEQLSLFETAEALHVSESTLRVRLHDARKIFNDVSARLRAQRFWVTRRGASER
jgi:RNA polymerase sigma-70 factor, ECF subfamily